MKTIIFLPLILNLLFPNENLLKYETSPYLLQHKNNPINWNSWNKKTIEKAKEKNKLIFISIGYSTCHWCHIMNKESFNNKDLANLLNTHFVNIKVDKEEHPHIDLHFQETYKQISNQRGGWPLTIILSKDMKILFIDKYIPYEEKYGSIGLKKIINNQIDQKLKNNINMQYKTSISKNKYFLKNIHVKNKKILSNIKNNYFNLMKKRYDKIYKGFDKNSKFPLSTHMNLLYDLSLLSKFENRKESFNMVNESLKKISNSGLNDYIDGGFYRYSIYENWTIPHFEKMLYTQAELISLYSKIYNFTNNELFKNTIIKTIEFTNKRLKTTNSLYYSAIDADSLNHNNEKQEGFYYTFNYENIERLLEKESIKNSYEILEYLGFEEFGNFEEEQNNIHLTSKKKPLNLEKSIRTLQEIRKNKIFPFIDKKIILSWNCLFIEALFHSSLINKKYLNQAKTSLDSLLKHFYLNKTLYHQKFDTQKAKQKALLEDYSFLINSLLTAYQYTFEEKYLKLAIRINQQTIEKFYKDNKWYADEEKEFEVTFTDRYYVSAISKQFHNMITISNLTYDLELLDKTRKMIKNYTDKIVSNIDKYPEAVRAIIRIKKGDVILKSNKKNLHENIKEIKTIKYPFLLLKEEKTDLHLACDKDSCFKYDKNIKNIINYIENY